MWLHTERRLDEDELPLSECTPCSKSPAADVYISTSASISFCGIVVGVE